VLPLLAGCGDVLDDEKSCTAIGCASGFSITALASEALRDGDYELELTLDEAVVTCAHPAVVSGPQQTGTCNGRNVRSSVVIHNGGAVGGVANAFVIDINDTPSLVLVRVLHDGETIGETGYEPAYQTSMPNGPECGPTCTTAPPEELRLAFE
jgi:hypothetical protein